MNVGYVVETMVSEYYSTKPKQKVDFKQAIEDYKDELLTGLTKEEREAIDAILEKYAEENPDDAKGYVSLLKGLLKKFGFKGDTDWLLMPEGGNKPHAGVEGGTEDVNNSISGNGASVSSDSTKSTLEKVTDSDGNMYVVVQMGNGITFKMKVAGETVSEENDKTAVKSSIDAYEKNLIFAD